MSGNTDFSGYLGSDGLRLIDSHNIYLQKCSTFLRKAREYKLENIRCKRSVIHSNKFGYESNEIAEKEVFDARNRYLDNYIQSFAPTYFGEGPDEMYKSTKEKCKRIRIIRELKEPVVFEVENTSSVGRTWFLRFYSLSKFIQAARLVILKLRMEKRLALLKIVVRDMLDSLENNEGTEKSEECGKQGDKSLCWTKCEMCPVLCLND